MRRVTLYSTLGCHLCEEAEQLLAAGRQAGLDFDLTIIDIADDDALVETYGIRIPVVAGSGQQTDLGWPFNLEQLLAYLREEQP